MSQPIQTAFPVGQSAPLYTAATMMVVIVMMMVAQLSISHSAVFHREVTKVEPSKTPAGFEARGPFRWAAVRTFAFVCLTYGFVIYFWTAINIENNFKYAWVTASVVISSVPIMGELVYHAMYNEMIHRQGVLLFRRLRGNKVMVDGVPLPPVMEIKPVKVNEYVYFLYALNYFSLTTLIVMSILCLYLFPGSGIQVYADTLARSTLVAAGAIIILFLLGDVGFKSAKKYRTGGLEDAPTQTQGLINTMIANKRAQLIELDKLQFKATPESFANLPPLSFMRSAGLAYPRNIPTNMIAHQIENKLIRPDMNTKFDVNDYSIIQHNENQAILVSSKDGEAIMDLAPGGSLNYDRHGLLGPVVIDGGNDKRPVVRDPPIDKGVQAIQDSEGDDKKLSTDRFIFRIFDDERPILFFENYVMGIGKGNGLFINTPGWLPLFMSLYFLAVEMQIWRNEGAGLMVAMITLAPCFVFAYIGHERQYLQLFWLNRMLGYFAIVVQRNIDYQNNGYTSTYLMNSTIIGDNTTMWLFESPQVTSPEKVLSVRFTSYLVFTWVCVWALFSIFQFFMVALPERGYGKAR